MDGGGSVVKGMQRQEINTAIGWAAEKGRNSVIRDTEVPLRP